MINFISGVMQTDDKCKIAQNGEITISQFEKDIFRFMRINGYQLIKNNELKSNDRIKTLPKLTRRISLSPKDFCNSAGDAKHGKTICVVLKKSVAVAALPQQ